MFLEPSPSPPSRSLPISVALHALVIVITLFVRWTAVSEGDMPFRAQVPTQRIRLTDPPAPRVLRPVTPVKAPAAEPEALVAPAVAVAPMPFQPRAERKPVTARRALIEPEIEAPPRALPLPPVPEVNLADHKMPVRTGTFDGDPAAAKPAQWAAVQSGGFGDPAAAPAPGGRTVASSGFGEPAAPARVARAAAGVADFGAAIAAVPVRSRQVEVACTAAFVPVEILDKPRPVYPEEARRARVQGAVAVRVVFSAGGAVRVLGVVRGLGHGLDEAASDAAARIRFRPALRNGQPVDEAAVVQIVFELA